MAESQVKQILEKEITCPLCLDIFKDPKKLRCDHVYCKECLKHLALRSLNATISCPECRFITQVPGSDISGFPTAFHINHLIEVFQQVAETSLGSPSCTCQAHPTQSLALYCETCHKYICRDCVLVSDNHKSHKYGYFKDLAPKYRDNVCNLLSLVKNQGASISNALAETVRTKATVSSHAVKCQDDIDHAFDGLFSILRECKEVMKAEVAAYYNSRISQYEQQENQLKQAEDELNDVITSVEATVQEKDQTFLLNVEGTVMKMKHLQEKLEIVPNTVTRPQVLVAQVVDLELFQKFVAKGCFVHKAADPMMCTIIANLEELHVDQQDTFILNLRGTNGNSCQGDNKVVADLVSYQGSVTKGKVERVSLDHVKINLTPKQRGRHKLSTRVNDAHIKDSPFSVVVKMPPKQLSLPVAIISVLKRPSSLVYSQGAILATEIEQSRIVSLDTEHQIQEFKTLLGVHKLTQDSDFNLYVSTTNDHKLHKFNKHGMKIKAIGQLGVGHAEFKCPSGLRVSCSNELYVCDSENHRIQVFNLDLDFERCFGKKGNAKGQFNYPSDIDFDSNNNIYVVENQNSRIQVFTANEHHIRTIGNQRHIVKFDNPTSLLIHNGYIYVTNSSAHNVVVIELSGEMITTFGSGCLSWPEGITVDEDGYIYIGSHRSIVVF